MISKKIFKISGLRKKNRILAPISKSNTFERQILKYLNEFFL